MSTLHLSKLIYEKFKHKKIIFELLWVDTLFNYRRFSELTENLFLANPTIQFIKLRPAHQGL